MIRPGSLALRGTRTAPLDYVFEFRGIDLTAAVLAAQVRDNPDNPGEPRLDFELVEEAGATGLRLISVTTVDGQVRSRVGLFATQADMEALPAAGSVGATLNWFWDMQITPDGGVKARYLAGSFILAGGVTMTASGSTGSGGGLDAIVTVSDEEIVVNVEGAALMSALDEYAAAITAAGDTALSEIAVQVTAAATSAGIAGDVLKAGALELQQPNLFTLNDLDFVSADSRYIDGGTAQATLTTDVHDGIPCWKASAAAGQTQSIVYEFPKALFGSFTEFRAAIRFLAADAATGGSGNRNVRFQIAQRDVAHAIISGTLEDLAVTGTGALSAEAIITSTTDSFETGCEFVRLTINIQNTNGSVARAVWFRDMICVAGRNTGFRRPIELASSPEAAAGTNAKKLMTPATSAAAIAAALVAPNASIAVNTTDLAGLFEAITSPRIEAPDAMRWDGARYPFFSYKSPSAYRLLTNESTRRNFVNAAIWTVAPYYVDASKADNSGDGLSPATAKRDINAAITAANGDGHAAMRIYVAAAGGNGYFQTRSINGSAGTIEPSKPCALIATGGRVRHWAGTIEQSWVNDGTGNSTYTGGPTSASRVFDRINLTGGRYTELTNVADQAAVRAAPGSWSDIGANLAVHRSDGLAPTIDNTLVTRNISVAALDSCTTDLYIEGFDFEGGPFGALWLDPIASRNVVLVDCTFRYGGTSVNMSDGLVVRRNKGLILVHQCDAGANWKDGFNYHWDRSAVSSITRSSGTATVTFSGAHGLDTGDTVLVRGCTQTEYNGSHVVTVTGSATLTFAVSGSPATPATGSPEAVGPPKMFVLQYKCTSGDNGRSGSSSNNGVTTHDNLALIDIDGDHEPTNSGAVFHCIEDTVTLVIGSTVTSDSGGDTERAAFKASNNAIMWLVGTTAITESGGDYGLYAQGTAGRIHKRDHTTVTGTEHADVGGLIDTY